MTGLALLLLIASFCVRADSLADANLQQYFETKVQQIASNCLSGIETREQWEELKPKYREQLFEMLGLSPRPPKGDLRAEVTGKIEREDFVVEKLHFQSMPGLYVTGNLYLPTKVLHPLPTILYLCGHGPVKTNGVSYGNKVAYQHHGAWFARNGYACLIIDTIELGEIEGVHHGTYNYGMWWWNSRGYTPAGVEAWNSIRALDYLETRPEVDKTRFGVTGRSGGGAYSWWISALDDRIKVSAPVAGITDLQNHVVDGVVEGHCDCMFFVNTYRWDYPLVAALVAPRPLLICNSDKDTIFPLDGVLRTHARAKKIYDLYGASKNLGLLITEGPHKDTQDLQVPVFRWFNRQLKGEDPVIQMAATKFFTPEELKVFAELPPDERTSHIHDTFVTRTPISNLEKLRATLLNETFGGWPARTEIHPYNERAWKRNSREVRSLEFDSEPGVHLKLFYLPDETSREVSLHVLTEDDLPALATVFREELQIEVPGAQQTADSRSVESLRRVMRETRATAAFLLVRGNGTADPKKGVQIRRRYMLVGQTLDGMRVWDIGRGVELLRSLPSLQKRPLDIVGQGKNAANVLVYAALSERAPASLTLVDLPKSEAEQPDYLNLTRFTTLNDLRELLSAALPAELYIRDQVD